jgi:hypothetical protein
MKVKEVIMKLLIKGQIHSVKVMMVMMMVMVVMMVMRRRVVVAGKLREKEENQDRHKLFFR